MFELLSLGSRLFLYLNSRIWPHGLFGQRDTSIYDTRKGLESAWVLVCDLMFPALELSCHMKKSRPACFMLEIHN